jgi:hypothetical protein
MRWWVVLLVCGEAYASPVTRCYEGNETTEKVATHFVLERELDAAKHEVREHRWRATNPTNEIGTTWKVADDGKTFTWKHDSWKIGGTGTLEGEPWKWTAYHTQAELQGMKGFTDAQLGSNTLTAKLHMEHDGKTEYETAVEATEFSCKDLAKRRGALDDTAPDAKHACYAGEQLGPDGKTQQIVVDEITEAKRIKLVTSYAGHDSRLVLKIEGTAIDANNPERSWSGVGRIDGKARAWTGYTFTAHTGGGDLTYDGSLGGAHATQTITATVSGRTITSKLAADAFDCAELAKRRAALR